MNCIAPQQTGIGRMAPSFLRGLTKDNNSIMKAKQQLILFLKQAPKAPDGLYTFTLPSVVALRDAKDYVHRMRVELSRLRNHMQAEGRPIRKWKMKLLSVKQTPDGKGSIITLKFCTHITRDVDQDLVAVLGVVASEGERLDEKALRGLRPAPPSMFPKVTGGAHVKIK